MLLTVLRRRSWYCSNSVWLCGLYYGALHVLKSSRALCPRVLSFLLAWWSARLRKKKLICVLLVHLFVYFVRVSFCCHFSLPLGVGGWLRFVMWHSQDISINFFNSSFKIKYRSSRNLSDLGQRSNNDRHLWYSYVFMYSQSLYVCLFVLVYRRFQQYSLGQLFVPIFST